MNLISLTDLKAFLEKAGTTQDDLLTLIVEGVSQKATAYIGGGLDKVSRTEKFNGGRKKYFVSAFPIDLTTPPVVSVDGSVKVINSDFKVDTVLGLFEFIYETYPTTPFNVSIQYLGGYPVDPFDPSTLLIPNDLKYACIKQAAYEFRNRDTLGISSVRLPDGGYQKYINGEFLPEVFSTLKRYRKIPGEQ